MAVEPLPRERSLNFEMAISLGLLLSSWQIASLWLPEYVAPGLQLIAADIIKMAQEGTSGIRFLPSSGSAKVSVEVLSLAAS
jgi:ABC-type nitrate/sulfonate/bicarbonate transport system permease component